MALTKETLYMEYVVNEMTDSAIAEKYGLTRSSISKRRKLLGIQTRDFVGYQSEKLAIEQLIAHGFEAEDMNRKSKTHPFDILVNGNIRVEVKSSMLSDEGYYTFTLSEKSDNGNVESDTRIRLGNGRTKKKYDKTCDYLVLVGYDPSGKHRYFVIPSNQLPTTLHGIRIPSTLNSKYAVYKDRWDFLMMH